MKFLEFGLFVNLLDGKPHKAIELANKFEVSIKTIYRHIDKLVYSGLPITTTTGKNGGIFLSEKYFYNTWFFTEQELAYILNVISSSKKFNPILNNVLQEKLQFHIKDKNFETASNLTGTFYIDNSNWFCSEATINNNQNIIEEAIYKHEQLKILYNNRNDVRIVNPYCLVYKDAQMYLYAYCNSKNNFRLFKLNRIQSISIINQTFEKQNIDLSTKPWNTNHNFDNIKITIKTDNKTKLEIDEWAKTKKIDSNTYSFIAVNNIGLIHKLMEYGNKITIISPIQIKNKLISECKNILNIYA